jgi:hypothetical protein
MPAPLVHIAYAQIYLDTRPELDVRKFMRGTVFPDVRRGANISRDLTHNFQATLADANRQSDSWQAGWWLHSYMDLAWNAWFVSMGLVVDDEAMGEETWRALKTAEEAKIFDHIKERNKIADMFEGALDEEELSSPAAAKPIQEWYSFVAWKLKEPYAPASWKEMLMKVGEPADSVEALLPIIDQYLHDEVWQQRLRELHLHLGMA